MSYPNILSAIKEMMRQSLLETPMARSIIRKSGFRPGVRIPEPEAPAQRTILSASPLHVSSPVSTGTYPYPLVPSVWNASGAGVYHHITLWDTSLATECRISVPINAVTSGGASIKAVWAPTVEDLRAGDWEDFSPTLALSVRGYFRSAWTAIPEGALGEVYISFVMVVATEIDEMKVGNVDLRIR